MAYKPPIDVRKLQEAGVLRDGDFYAELSKENNYMDPKVAKEFYMGFVRAVTSLLRKNGVARLPHIGVFAVVKRKDQVMLFGKTKKHMGNKHSLKFYPSQSWKAYFTKLSDQLSQRGESLDPRERILKRKL